MSDMAMTTAVREPAEPDGAPRLPVLDVLRGVAILGILFMNINDMGASLFASFSGDPRALGWTGADQVAWWLREVLANGTARCLLEMLFGVGMVILTDRAATRMGKWRVLRGYAWRNFVLFLFGLVHVFVLLWPGDILHTYGLAAIVAVLFRGLRPRWLLTIGLLMATLQLAGGSFYVISSQGQRTQVATLQAKQAAGTTLSAPERKQLDAAAKREKARAKGRAETQAQIAAEDRARTGTAATWAQSAWSTFLFIEKQFLEFAFIWEAAGTMLIGAALYKMGIVQGQRSRRFYLGMTLLAYAAGCGLRAWGGFAQTRFDHVPSLAFAFGEYARLLTTLGHIGLVNWLLTSAGGARIVKPFAAAGRTALSIYILQTLITLWVLFPPWGFALYNKMGWAALMLVSLAIDAALLALAIWWVRRFSIGPVEWAWRSIIAQRALPFRLREPARVGGVPLPA